MVCPYPVFTTDLLLRSTDYFQEIAGKEKQRERERNRSWYTVCGYISRGTLYLRAEKCRHTMVWPSSREERAALPCDRLSIPFLFCRGPSLFRIVPSVLHLPKRPLCPLVFVLRSLAKSSTLLLSLSFCYIVERACFLCFCLVSRPSIDGYLGQQRDYRF